jgi:hypothetical protein
MHAELMHAEQMHAEQAGVHATGELQPQAAFDEQRASAHANTYEQTATYEQAAGSHTQAHTTQAHTYGAYDVVSIFKRIYFFYYFSLSKTARSPPTAFPSIHAACARTLCCAGRQ